jgi:2-amino-4-hydroxy-6-hydroxymethyldihydropteridine diphosphokinase
LKTVYLGLGSNIGDRAANLREAVERLENEEVAIVRRSSLYETEPRDFLDQASFLNAVVEATTDLFPLQLLARIRKLERDMGRQRVIPKGPRNIDIDILFYGRSIIQTAELETPHPRLSDRRFVLEPLAEIAPEFRHPVTGKLVREILAALEPQGVRRLDTTF